MRKKRIFGALVSAGSLAAGLALAGCSPTPAPLAPPTEHNERPEPAANDKLEVAGPSPESESKRAAVRAEEQASDKVAAPAERSPAPPPPPQGAPPSWLAKAPAIYRAGDAAQYLQKDCKARVYIDAGAMVGSSASDVRAVVELALKAREDPKEETRVKKALAVIADAGVDPIANWREVVACGNEQDVTALGFTSDKALEVPLLVQKVLVALGEEPGIVTREGDMSILATPDGPVIVQPAPNVFLVSKNREALLAGIKMKAGGPGFTAARGHLLFAKTPEVDAGIKQSGDRLDISLTAHLGGGAGRGPKKDPKAVTTKVEGRLKAAADELKGTPLEPLGERLRAAKVAVRGEAATITGSVQRSSLLSILKGLSPSELKELIKSLK